MTPRDQTYRPGFLEQLSHAYSLSRKNIVTMTGDVTGLFFSSATGDFVSMEQAVVGELKDKFTLMRVDIATGIRFFDDDTQREVVRVCESQDGIRITQSRQTAMKQLIEQTRHQPLAAIVLLQGIHEAFIRVRKLEDHLKPLCIIFQYAGAIFPAGDFSRLADLDRQRLVMFLSWVTDPEFFSSPDLILLVNTVKSEINHKINALPHCCQVEIPLPNDAERRHFVDLFHRRHPKISFEGGKTRFIANTAGLKLGHIKDLLEVGRRSGKAITKKQVVAQVNNILQAELGEIIRIKFPAHKPSDIVGYKETGTIIRTIFERCEDPETAVSAILVSGPNGSGKTFQLEAFASESGRVVIELAGIRGSYFGETDRFFELLRWHIATFGKILILVDEAHTAFGSIHDSGTHQTEMRLAGNIIKMMGDPQYLSKVVWALMTSRPDELDPDIKSRAPVQIPIFDLEGVERRDFVFEMFARKNVDLDDQALNQVLEATSYYSARDYRNLVAEVLAQRRKEPELTVMDVLSGWQASKSIKTQREFQALIAATHCSYPKLLPSRLAGLTDAEITEKINQLKWALHR